jgi:hypothetical protein
MIIEGALNGCKVSQKLAERWSSLGLLTVAIGFFAFLFLPNSVSTAKFLTEKERLVAQSRLSSNTPGPSAAEAFSWSEVRRGVLNTQLWLSATAYFAILSGLYS